MVSVSHAGRRRDPKRTVRFHKPRSRQISWQFPAFIVELIIFVKMHRTLSAKSQGTTEAANRFAMRRMVKAILSPLNVSCAFLQMFIETVY